jgi:hypothetical protein
MKKISRLTELRILSDEDFDRQIDELGNKMFAQEYGVTSSMLSKEKHYREMMREKNYGLSRNEFEIVSEGAWENSPERKSFVNAGLLGNKSIKYDSK